jgi:UDP-N-acetylmuramoylalanine--D-glutamate ligase
MEINGSNVLVLGLGDTGLSMARWLAHGGASVHVADTRSEPPGAEALRREVPDAGISAGAWRDADFAAADWIAVSPGIDLREPQVADALRRGIAVVGDIELFAQALARRTRSQADTKSPELIAITGSNGKSTVTAMAGALCRAAGRQTVVAGNIGLPVLDALMAAEAAGQMPDTFVLELSSFQLESTYSLVPSAATVLNITEDHLDRYTGLDDYAAAKARIFDGGGAQILNRDDTRSMRMVRPGRAVHTFGTGAPRRESDWGITQDPAGRRMLAQGKRTLLALDELSVAGLHNASNALAALALTQVLKLPKAALMQALREFKGLPHRVEKIAEIAGIPFYDDSKGTNVGATVAALTGFDRQAVLIAGGDGKGQDFSPLATAVAARARAVVLIGRDADAIDAALASTSVPRLRAATLEEAVGVAYHEARPGDAVLLSPACASFDMFRNYVHRAEVFVQAVNALAEGSR